MLPTSAILCHSFVTLCFRLAVRPYCHPNNAGFEPGVLRQGSGAVLDIRLCLCLSVDDTDPDRFSGRFDQVDFQLLCPSRVQSSPLGLPHVPADPARIDDVDLATPRKLRWGSKFHPGKGLRQVLGLKF
jgi:hypothetical protein